MAVNFHQPSVYALFDAMPAPLLTFAVSGLVTYANPAAKQHPGQPVESLSGNLVIKSLVAAATLGKLKLPYTAKIEIANGEKIEGQFMAGPAGLDIAFLARTDTDGAVAIGRKPAQMKLRNIIELLRDELMPPLSLLSQELKALPRSPTSTPLALATQALQQRLLRLADLVEVFGNDVLHLDDRIEPANLLRQVCSELGERAGKMGVRFDLSEPDQTLPPIYGNQQLVQRAFVECLENAMLHSRKEISTGQTLTVQINFALSGEHVLIAVRNRGASPLRLTSQDAVRPFMSQDAVRPFMSQDAGSAEAAPRLGLPLVQRIVSLHGGNMRLSNVDDDTTQVLMEFPTGAPMRGQEQLDITQAQRYAKDLAQLMSRRKKENT